MAKDIGNILLIGGIGVGAYFLYQYMTSTPAVAAPAGGAPATGTSPAGSGGGSTPLMDASKVPPPTPVQYNPPSQQTVVDTSLLEAQLAQLTTGINTPQGLLALNNFLAQHPELSSKHADAVYTGLLNSVQGDLNFTGSGPATSATPYQWNFYLARIITSPQLPGPGDVFPGLDVNQPMTLATYWAAMAPWLVANAGLSGLGLYGGLGAFLTHHPRLRRVS